VLLPSSYSANYNVTKVFVPTSITDPDGDTMTVWWNWGDGSALTMGDAGADYSASHNYSIIGSRTITVWADDGQGHNVSATAPVTIAETNQKAQAISIVLNPSRTTFWVNTTVNFTVMLYDYEGDVVTLTVDWGDGSTPSSQSVIMTANVNQEVSLTHVFTAASTVPYTVVATVDDNQDHSNPTLDTAEVDVSVSVWTPPSEEDGGGGIDTMTLALIGIVIVVVVLLAVLLLMKRRKKGAEGGEAGGMEGMAPPE
jgi:LPXTG-motif cell wall-anchored protein